MDEIEVEVLPDGRIKVTTPGISTANHVSADKLLGLLAQYMGGEVETIKTKRGHTHHRTFQGRTQRQ